MSGLKQSTKIIAGLLLILMVTVPLSAQNDASDQLLKMVPSDSLFCVIINNFDYSMNQTDQFLAGVSPMPMGVSMLVRMQLAQLLGNPQLAGLNTNGNFAAFGTVMSSDTAGPNPLGNLFVGILAPVTDYQQLVTSSPNFSEPDENGISKIMRNGNPIMLAAKEGNYVLLSWANEPEKFSSFEKTMSAGISKNLSTTLDKEDTNQATTEPIWIYANIQNVSTTFGPMISAKIEEIKSMFNNPQMGATGAQAKNVSNIMDIYATVLDILFKETKSVSLGINPKPNVLNITKTITAVSGSDMAKMFTSDTSPAENKLVGYLEDGALMNVAGRIDVPLLKTLNDKGIDIYLKIASKDMTPENVQKMKTFAADWINTLGGSMAISAFAEPGSKPPFAARYVFSIKDEKQFNTLIDQIPQMFNLSGLTDFYKGMGIEMGFEITRGVENYKGVSIDSAKLVMKSTDANTPQGQMLNNMYGGGFSYRWGLVNGLYAMTIGSNVENSIHELIDQIQAGGPTEIAPEVKTAMALVPHAEKDDFFMTYNFIRLFKMVTSMVPAPIPQVNVPSKSNIAIGGIADNGKMVVNIAIPKEHLSEIMSTFMMMQMQQQQQQQQQNNNSMN